MTDAAATPELPMRLAAAMLVALLANYTGWALGLPAPWATATLSLYLIAFAGYLVAPGPGSAHAIWTRGFLLALLLIGLGSVVDTWDARSIWMFHGKRIYLEADLYAQLDGYFALGHNDYPVLVPALAASIARLLGGWNEVAPKLAGMLVWVPALLVILELLPTRAASLLFLVALLTINGAGLIDGMVDMPLALMATACAAAMQRLLAAPPAVDADAPPPATLVLLPPLLLALMSVSKNEGLALAVLLLLVFAAMAVARRRLAQLRLTLALSVASFAPAIAWASACRDHGIVVDLGPGALSRLAARLPSLDAHALIVRELIASTPLLICVLVATWGLAGGSSQWRRLALPLVVAGLYPAMLYGVYLSTPNDLQWHLGSSAGRILHSVELLLLYAGLSAGFAPREGCGGDDRSDTPADPARR